MAFRVSTSPITFRERLPALPPCFTVKYLGRMLRHMSNKEAEKEEMKDQAHDVEDQEQEEEEEKREEEEE